VYLGPWRLAWAEDKMVVESSTRVERCRERMSGTNFIMMVIMILILLFVLMNVGPLVTI
jgi:uncharacterized protein YqhQ